MPRVRINLEPHRDQIREWLEDEGLTQEEVVAQLASRHGIRIAARTMRRFLTAAGIGTALRYEDDHELRRRILNFHYMVQCSDKESIAMLALDGFEVSQRRLQRMRLAMGLKQRSRGACRAEMDTRMREALDQEMEQGHIEDFGKMHLYQYMRSQYNIAGRERLYRIVRDRYPEVVEPRRQKAKRHRGKIIVPGPLYSLSMDGHCKLEKWGIQIYAAIDVYSRHIVWIYIGITGRSQVSVLAQYLATAKHKGVIPLLIRADRGAETCLAAAAHFALSQQARTKADGTPLTISDAFRPGTSKENVSIEVWWNQQTRSTLGRWRQYFDTLNDADLYVRDRLADRLAFLAVYIPIIRTESLDFVQVWNHHPIRKQKGDHIISGRPYQMYNYPELSSGIACGVPVDQEALDRMIADVIGFDLDEYLPAHTKQWCDEELIALGFEGLDGRQFLPDRKTRRHQVAYLQLRDHVQAHINAGNEAVLDECPRPTDPTKFWRANAPLRQAMANLYEANVAAGRPLDLDMDPVDFRERDANGEAHNEDDREYARLRRDLLLHANEADNVDENAERRQELERQIQETEDAGEVAVLWEELEHTQQQLHFMNNHGPEYIEAFLQD
nr:hypothetical protein B0A51_08610 [Rachicladosporium sp. CCFEE 5018]